MRYILTVLFVFLITVIQTTMVHHIALFGIVPNLILVAIICYSLVKGEYKALVFGIVCGLILDFIGGRTVGINTLLCTYVAYLCIFIQERLFSKNSFVAGVFVLGISVIYEFMFYILNYFIWGHTAILFAITHKILPGAVYNALSTVAVFPVVRRLCSNEAIFRPRKRG